MTGIAIQVMWAVVVVLAIIVVAGGVVFYVVRDSIDSARARKCRRAALGMIKENGDEIANVYDRMVEIVETCDPEASGVNAKLAELESRVAKLEGAKP